MDHPTRIPTIEPRPTLGTREPAMSDRAPLGYSQNDDDSDYEVLRVREALSARHRMASQPRYPTYYSQAGLFESPMASPSLSRPTVRRVFRAIPELVEAGTARIQAEIIALNATDPAAARRRALERNDQLLQGFFEEEEEEEGMQATRPASPLRLDHTEIARLVREEDEILRAIEDLHSQIATTNAQAPQTMRTNVRNAVLRQPYQPTDANARGFTWRNSVSMYPRPPMASLITPFTQAEHAAHTDAELDELLLPFMNSATTIPRA